MSNRSIINRNVLSVVLGATIHGMAFAQAQDPGQLEQAQSEAKQLDSITVVGSRLSTTRTEGPSPVKMLGQEQIEATGAISGDELLQAIPQVGTMMFDNTYTGNNLNAARGDVGSINLRNVGTGNTLLLVNGRRMVAHPMTQTENNVPVQTPNMNAIPLYGLQRTEVLLGGASALYGADAVAGVVNMVMDTHFQGLRLQAQYGGSEGVSLRQGNVNFKAGKWFNDGRTRVTLLGGWTHRTDFHAMERPYSATMYRIPFFDGTEFEGVTAADPRLSASSWGAFQTIGGVPVRNADGDLITNASGQFHIDPIGFHDCSVELTADVCIVSGPQNTVIDRPLRFAQNHNRLILGGVDRINAFGTIEQDINDNFVAFGEMSLYAARYKGMRNQEGILGAAPIVLSRTNYYNPFGAMYRPDGSPNPYRLPGIDAPEEGLDIRLTNYRVTDVPRPYYVDDYSYRVLAGVRGMVGGFDWETAVLYSAADSKDVDDGGSISNSRLTEALSWSTPDAYNPFWGGNLENWEAPLDPSRNQAAIDHFTVQAVRRSRSTVAQLDTRLLKEDLFAVPAGHVGVAFGAEWRRESLMDDRDKRLDGTITFTNPITNAITSDLLGSSPVRDTRGHRSVASAYAEFAIPLVSPSMSIPLVRALDLQVAGRYEHYSDFGSVSKPKVSLAWDVFDGLMLRANWSESFLAPNLMQMKTERVTTESTTTDHYMCEADIRNGTIPGVHRCSRSYSVVLVRGGNPDLKPEESESWSAGMVFKPRFLPEGAGRLTLSADYWVIDQENVVGLAGSALNLALDYLLRVQGSHNPRVVRHAPDADRIALFDGTGLTPAGAIDYVEDTYVNLQPKRLRGIDLGADWRLDTESAGTFYASLNASRLIEISQSPTPDQQRIIDAQEAGIIDDNFRISNAGDLLGLNDRPKWRATLSASWRKDEWGVGTFVTHVGGTDWTSMISNLGNYYRLPSWTTTNLWVERDFGQSAGVLNGTRVRLTVRNVADRDPPFVPTIALGFNTVLHNALGRGYYLTVTKDFD